MSYGEVNTLKFTIVNNKAEWDTKLITKEYLFLSLPSLNERDMHIIDNKMQFRISGFTSKPEMILIKLDNIRAIILKECAMFCLDTSTRLLNPTDVFYTNLTNKIKNNIKLPFELCILEEIFIYTSNIYDNELKKLAPDANNIIMALESHSHEKMNIDERHIANIQVKLTSLHFKVKDIYDLIKDLFDWNNTDYIDLYLSEDKEHDNEKKEIIIQQVEEIITTYMKHFEENMDILNNMNKNVDTLLKIIDIRLSVKRSKLSEKEIKLTVLMLSVSFANLLSSIYGMNVPNYLEENNNAFIIFLFVIVFGIIMLYFVFLRIFNAK